MVAVLEPGCNKWGLVRAVTYVKLTNASRFISTSYDLREYRMTRVYKNCCGTRRLVESYGFKKSKGREGFITANMDLILTKVGNDQEIRN